MATYAYKCADCGEAFEIMATIKEKEEAKGEKFACPKCGSKNIKPEFSAGNFIKNIFKGEEKACGCCSDGGDCDGDHEAEKKDGKEDKDGCGCGCC